MRLAGNNKKFYGINIFAKVLQIKKKFLTPVILVFCVVGAYGIGGKIFDVYLLIAFGVLGYLLTKYNFSTAPIVLGMILGTIAESNFRRGMMMFDGNWTIFFTRPISLSFLILALIFLFIPLYQLWKNRKKEI